MLEGKCVLTISLGETHSLAIDITSTVYGAGRTENCALGSSDTLTNIAGKDGQTIGFKLSLPGIADRVTAVQAGDDFSVLLTSKLS